MIAYHKALPGTAVRRLITAALLLFFCMISFAGDLLQSPVKKTKNFPLYPVNNSRSLISRVQKVPDFILNTWMEWDEKSDYTPYFPDESELKLIEKYIEMLPPLIKTTMKERMLGIYFVNNLLGSGITDWVLDENNNIYTYMIFNPMALKMNISDLVTWKEQTCFIQNDSSYSVRIDLDSDVKGFFYILLHESAHIVDYVNQLTPFTEPEIRRFIRNSQASTAFTIQVWKDYKKTIDDYPFRSGLTFYGFGNGPRIPVTDTVTTYSAMAESPFISLYGAQNWAEDLAEFITFYHLVQKMGMKYRISVYRNGEAIYRLEPAKNPRVMARFPQMEVFYRVTPYRKK